MNEIIFLWHASLVAISLLGALALGKEALISLICLQGILSNLFVSQQMTLFGFDVTCSDVFAVGAILGLNLLQEYFGRNAARKAIALNFLLLIFYLIMTQIHMSYTPNSFDTMHSHFQQLLSLMPRITIASIAVYGVTQLFDSYFFQVLRTLLNGRYFAMRSIISVTCSQLLDTILFSFLALYGVVGSVFHIIAVSFAIKMIVIAGSSPFVALSKKIIPPK